MKRIALAAALMAAYAGTAMAQSSVTLYGRLNTSVEFQDNEVTDKTIMRNNASRWGLRGQEDLGAGLQAFFQAEAGFGSDDGSQSQPGKAFGRDVFVGLRSKALGEVQMGRFFSPLYYATIDYIGNFNHNTGTTSEDNLYALNFGFDNGVQYTTPSFGGFKLAAAVNAGENANSLIYNGANRAASKAYEVVASFDSGNLHLAGGYSQAEDSAKRDVIKGYSVAGWYSFGAFGIGANYTNSDDSVWGKRDHVTATAMFTFGASELHGQFGWAGDWDNISNSEGFQYVLGYNYNLSKRTKVYAFYQLNDNGSFVYGGGSLPALANKTWSAIGLGVRHNF